MTTVVSGTVVIIGGMSSNVDRLSLVHVLQTDHYSVDVVNQPTSSSGVQPTGALMQDALICDK